MSEKLVIVGKGMAAARLARELSEHARGRYAVLVIGDEPRLAYNRVLLSSLLADDVALGDLELASAAWWKNEGMTTLYGQRVTRVERDSHCIETSDGRRFGYSKLVFATGSQPIRLPKPGMDLPGVLTFRDVADVDAMRRLGKGGARAVVIGGGLLGIEAAYGLAKAGAKVTLVHIMDRLMERQLDARAGALLKQALEARGITVLLEADSARVQGTDHAEALELADGRVLPAEVVVCGIGIRPNVALARECGLAVNRGIVVDDAMTTSDPDVFALGECAEHRGTVYGLVEPAYEQARVLARNLAGDARAAYAGSTLATNLKVSGVPVFSAGDFLGTEHETITYADEGAGIYRKLVLAQDRLAGAVLFGDTSDGLWFLDLIRTGADVRGLRDTLMFGRDLDKAA